MNGSDGEKGDMPEGRVMDGEASGEKLGVTLPFWRCRI